MLHPNTACCIQRFYNYLKKKHRFLLAHPCDVPNSRENQKCVSCQYLGKTFLLKFTTQTIRTHENFEFRKINRNVPNIWNYVVFDIRRQYGSIRRFGPYITIDAIAPSHRIALGWMQYFTMFTTNIRHFDQNIWGRESCKKNLTKESCLFLFIFERLFLVLVIWIRKLFKCSCLFLKGFVKVKTKVCPKMDIQNAAKMQRTNLTLFGCSFAI